MNISKYYKSIILEAKNYAKKPFPLAIAFLAPVIGMLFLGYAFKNSSVVDIPIAVLNLDNTAASRTIARYLDATQTLNVVYDGPDRDYVESLMKEQKTFLTIIIPKGSEEKIKHKEAAEITAVSNGAALIYSKIAYKAVALTTGTINAGIQLKRMEASGMTSLEAKSRALPVRVEMTAPGNPWYDYAIYMIPGLAMALLQMSASFSCLWLFRDHFESDKGPYVGRKKEKFSRFIGKVLPIFIANVAALVAIYYWIFPMCGVPINNGNGVFFYLSLLFIFVSMGFGAALSILLRNITTAAQMGLVVNAPAFVFAGYTFPRWAMPEFAQVIAQALPITHVLDGMFPSLMFDTVTDVGVKPLLIIGAVVWGIVFIFASPLGDKYRVFEKKLLKINDEISS